MADIAQAAIQFVAAAEASADAARAAATSAAATAARSRDVGQVVQELVQELTQERAKNVLLQSRLDAAEVQIQAQMLGIAEGRQEKGALESQLADLRRDYDDQQVAFAEERRGLLQSRLDSEQRLPGVSSRGPPEPRLARPEQKGSPRIPRQRLDRRRNRRSRRPVLRPGAGAHMDAGHHWSSPAPCRLESPHSGLAGRVDGRQRPRAMVREEGRRRLGRVKLQHAAVEVRPVAGDPHV